MLHYILQILIFQLLFLVLYELFLKRETFFSSNRWYLLITPLISLLLPFVKLNFLGGFFEGTPAASWSNVLLPEVYLGARPEAVETLPEVSVNQQQGFQPNWWLVAYFSGFTISLILLLRKTFSLWRLFRFKKKAESRHFRLIEVPKSRVAFSFYKTVFLGGDLSETEKQQILPHELVHVKQLHSLDLLLFELLKIIFWFNPLVYVFQQKIAMQHEFLADDKASKTLEKKSYFEQLLNTAFNTQQVSFINQFFNHSLIKKRIIMLQKSRSKSIAKFKFLIIVPIILVMLTYVACSDDNSAPNTEDDSLAQYSYTLKKPEDLKGKVKSTHEKYESFLKKNHPDYVSWATIDYEADEITYSVHDKNEKVPDGYTDLGVEFPDGSSYVMYMNLKDTTKYESKLSLDSISPFDELESNEIPYMQIDEVPVFEGCENLITNEECKKCTSTKIQKFVNKNFNTEEMFQYAKPGVNRVIVQFKIDKTGKIVDVKARAPHPKLEEEAIRVISSIPDMTPGKQDGQNMGVMYSLPIVFQVADE